MLGYERMHSDVVRMQVLEINPKALILHVHTDKQDLMSVQVLDHPLFF